MRNDFSLARYALYTKWCRAMLELAEVTERFKEEGLLFVPFGNKQKAFLSVPSAISVRDALILASFAPLR
jgi:hypothetical protein